MAKYVRNGRLPAEMFILPAEFSIALCRIETHRRSAQVDVARILWKIQNQRTGGDRHAVNQVRAPPFPGRDRDGENQAGRKQVTSRFGTDRQSECESRKNRVGAFSIGNAE